MSSEWEAGWSQPVWTVLRKRKPFAPVGIQTPDRILRSEFLYQLQYPVSHSKNGEILKFCILSVGQLKLQAMIILKSDFELL